MEGTPKYDKRIEIDWQGKKEEVLLRKPKWGQKNRIAMQCVKTAKVGEKKERELDEVEFKERLVLAAIVKAPFELKLEIVQDLPMDVGDKILEEVENMLKVKEDVKKN